MKHKIFVGILPNEGVSVDEYIARKCRESKLIKLYTVVNIDRDLYYERHGDIPMKY